MATPPSCHDGQNGSILAQTTEGTAPYAYQWQAGGTDSLLSGLGAGSYVLSVTDATGCVERDTFTLVAPAELTAGISSGGLTTICNESGMLSATASGGTTPYSFAWSNGPTTLGNNGIGPGDYLLTVLDSNGCGATASFTLAAGDTVLVQSAAAICEGETYAWNGIVLGTDTTLCQVFTLPNGCDSTTCLSLAVNALPQPTITATGTLCNQGEVSLSVGAFPAISWSNGGIGPSISVGQVGEYSVTVTNGAGCTATSSIEVAPAVSLDFSSSPPSCAGDSDGSISIALPGMGTPPFLYAIDSVSFAGQPVFDGLPPGEYWPSVLDATGCKVVAQAVFPAPTPIVLDAGSDVEISLGESVALAATTNLASPTVSWSPSQYLSCTACLAPVATPLGSIEYIVTVQDEHGCGAADSLFIKVAEASSVYVPTAFTPNGDGVNDRLTVFGDASIARVASFKVFDRWGGQVYDATDLPTNDTGQGWDGSFRGEEMPSGAYTFVITLLWVDGRASLESGSFTLLR
jgi:gliding motility-associated-like protein